MLYYISEILDRNYSFNLSILWKKSLKSGSSRSQSLDYIVEDNTAEMPAVHLNRNTLSYNFAQQ